MKNKIRQLNQNFTNCNTMQSALVMIILSVICVFLQSVAQMSLNGWGGFSYIVFPLLLFLNALPVFLLMTVVYCFTNRVWIAFLVAVTTMDILLIVNYFKVYFRAETLSVHDFSLFNEATNIMGGYEFPIPIQLIMLVILSIVLMIYVCRHIKQGNTAFLSRLILLLVTVSVSVGSYFTFYDSKKVYASLPSFGGQFNDINISAHKGFIYTFLSHISTYSYQKPEGYSDEVINSLMGDDPTAVATPNNKVNIIAIMSEAFFDMESAPNIEFNDGLNPTPNLNRLKNESLWGHILVPGFAGSTASTEFEFLTGLNISQIDSAMPVVYKTHVNTKTYGLVQMLDDMGYQTSAFHPGNAWFYSRKAVYPRLGFNRAEFENDIEYTDADKVNYYISDDFTANKILANYNDYLKSGSKDGYMSFTVTIQNHGPYSSSEPQIKRIKTTDNIDSEGYNILSNYANGLYDADALLGKVCDGVEDVDVPTVVVFFGDHLPYFDADGKYLTWLGLDVTSDSPYALENRYSTPYIVHGNKAFRDLKNSDCEKNIEHISSSFLAVEMLKYIGVTPSPYFNAISHIEQKISHMCDYFYIENGQNVVSPSNDGMKTINDYRCIAYWALRDYAKMK
ncbi:MAG: LTA synthase family protein [Clostridia bacterium]|nr:LTA synthase family protein [Clostridia bacterium]